MNSFSLNVYLQNNLGIATGIATTYNSKQVWQWLGDGGKYEDAPPGTWPPYLRSRNHFHNPLLPWDEAYYTDWLAFCTATDNPPFFISGHCPESAILWSLGPQYPDIYGIDLNPGGDWSWKETKKNYYDALTSVSTSSRNTSFANTFRGLGQLMHLIQDMSVPEHTRNDSHVYSIRNDYEEWVADHVHDKELPAYYPTSDQYFSGTINSIASFFDADQYTGTNPAITLSNTIGLAEYTNANYLSPGTMFTDELQPTDKHYFPYPSKDNVIFWWDATNNRGYVQSGWTGSPVSVEIINHLAVQSLFYGYRMLHFPDKTMIMMPFGLDDKCREEYASKLIPRAVGYSAGLLHYFFRGTLDVSWPETGVYSIADGSQTLFTDANGNHHQQFTKIKAAILNTTPNEAIVAGTLTAVARYKIIPNYAPDLSNYPPDGLTMTGDQMNPGVEYSYSVSATKTLIDLDEIDAINDSDRYGEFTFDFTNQPIPAGITDLTLQVVFKGTLGNEADNAIAIGMKDIMEPTHLTFWNLTDMFSLQYPTSDYMLYTFDTLQNMVQTNISLLNWLDDTKDGSLNDELFLMPVTSSFSISFWNGSTMSHAVTVDIPAGGHIWPIVIANQSDNNYFELKWVDPVRSGTLTSTYSGVVNQADQSGTYGTPTSVFDFRKKLSLDGQTLVPIIQHKYTGIVGCRPGDGSIYCPYSEEGADLVTLPPTPFMTDFN
jgi:hypothetical protein